MINQRKKRVVCFVSAHDYAMLGDWLDPPSRDDVIDTLLLRLETGAISSGETHGFSGPLLGQWIFITLSDDCDPAMSISDVFCYFH